MKISFIKARQILDSRGNPTIEVEMSDGIHQVRSSVPSGASTGSHEALELRDGDMSVYCGKGVLQAQDNIEKIIAPELVGKFSVDNQKALDDYLLDLDGTPNKSRLGANALLGVSLASCRLAAAQQSKPLWEHIRKIFQPKDVILPLPMMNILNGGKHGNNGLAIQEFMICPRLQNFRENLQAGSEIFHTLKKILQQTGHSVGVGDEGGFAPKITQTREAFDIICRSIKSAGYVPGKNIFLAIDAAASEFCENDVYMIDEQKINRDKLTEFYLQLIDEYPIISIEDSHHESDVQGFIDMQKACGEKIQLVGDDLFVTNVKRLQEGIDQEQANAILIKVNQIGTLSETFDAMKLAQENNFSTIISHRSGETEDSFIADLAVGTGAGQIKTGSLSRTDRVSKYNQLLRISESFS